MLPIDAVQPSWPEWAPSISFVTKEDRTIQLCVKYYKHNIVTIWGSSTKAGMKEYIACLLDATVVSTTDDNCRYWRMKLPREIAISSLSDPLLDNSDSLKACSVKERLRTCQWKMDLVSSSGQNAARLFLSKWYSQIFKLPGEHIKHLQQVLTLLNDAGITLVLKKCKCFMNHVNFLQPIIKTDFMKVSSHTPEGICGLKTHLNITSLRSYIGLDNSAWKRVANFGRIAELLNYRLAKNPLLEYTKSFDEKLEALHVPKEKPNPPLRLALPQLHGSHNVETDAYNGNNVCIIFQQLLNINKTVLGTGHDCKKTRNVHMMSLTSHFSRLSGMYYFSVNTLKKAPADCTDEQWLVKEDTKSCICYWWAHSTAPLAI